MVLIMLMLGLWAVLIASAVVPESWAVGCVLFSCGIAVFVGNRIMIEKKRGGGMPGFLSSVIIVGICLV